MSCNYFSCRSDLPISFLSTFNQILTKMKNFSDEDHFLRQNQTALFYSMALPDKDIPEGTFSLLMEYTSYTMICIAAFGLVGNILIIITYTSIGFSESINISYSALSISDIFCILFLTWHAICFVPAFSNSDIPFEARKFVIPTGGHTSAIFLKTTAWITAYISLERCLCVVFPLKIKTIVKRKRTIVVIVAIFSLTLLPLGGIVFYTYVFNIVFDATKNITFLSVMYRKSSLSNVLTRANYVYKLVFMNFTPFGIILICAVVLTVQLNRSASWRREVSLSRTETPGESTTSNVKTQKKHSKETRVARTVLAIALTFIFPGTLSTIRYVCAMTWNGFHPIGVYAKLFEFTSRLEFLLSLANSSVNFIIYYRSGTKFRHTVQGLVLRNRSSQ